MSHVSHDTPKAPACCSIFNIIYNISNPGASPPDPHAFGGTGSFHNPPEYFMNEVYRKRPRHNPNPGLEGQCSPRGSYQPAGCLSGESLPRTQKRCFHQAKRFFSHMYNEKIFIEVWSHQGPMGP